MSMPPNEAPPSGGRFAFEPLHPTARKRSTCIACRIFSLGPEFAFGSDAARRMSSGASKLSGRALLTVWVYSALVRRRMVPARQFITLKTPNLRVPLVSISL